MLFIFSTISLSSSFRASYRISISAGKSFYKLFHPRCFGAFVLMSWIYCSFVRPPQHARPMNVYSVPIYTLPIVYRFGCGAPHIEELCQLSATSCCAEKCNNFFSRIEIYKMNSFTTFSPARPYMYFAISPTCSPCLTSSLSLANSATAVSKSMTKKKKTYFSYDINFSLCIFLFSFLLFAFLFRSSQTFSV